MPYCKSRSLSPLKLKLLEVFWTTAGPRDQNAVFEMHYYAPPSMRTVFGLTPTREGEKLRKNKSKSPGRNACGVNSTMATRSEAKKNIQGTEVHTDSKRVFISCYWRVVDIVQCTQAIESYRFVAISQCRCHSDCLA
jgi:hypothetical protein